MMKLFTIWVFKPVVVVLWLIHLGAAYAQGRRCSMGCNPTRLWMPVPNHRLTLTCRDDARARRVNADSQG